MIKLERPALNQRLEGTLSVRSTEAATFYRKDKVSRSQRRLDFSLSIDWVEMELSKCAYCEQRLRQSGVHTCRYRPEAAARDWPQGQEWPEHYWWIAFEWRNLMPLCSQCMSLKRNLFSCEKAWGRRSFLGSTADGRRDAHRSVLRGPSRSIDWWRTGCGLVRRASKPHGAWESAMNAAFSASTSPAKEAANFGLSRSK
jgi:hypothetical protein